MRREQTEEDKEEIKSRIGKAMRQRREELNVSQEHAANLCGAARSYYAEVEKGHQDPTSTNLVRIATGLDLTAAELLGVTA